MQPFTRSSWQVLPASAHRELPSIHRPRLVLPATLVCLLCMAHASAQTPVLTIDASAPVGKVSPLHYGLMTEEINHSYDGGLYAELLRNRSFQDQARQPVHWQSVGGAEMALESANPVNPNLPVSLRFGANGSGRAGVANEGYWGIPVRPNTRYRASFYAKASSDFKGPLTVWIESADGSRPWARASVSGLTTAWRKFTVSLTTGPDAVVSTNNRFAITTLSRGAVTLSLVSLFPPTWKNRPNGLRRDLMQMLVDLKPGFLRFPGGNYVEGNTLADRFDWKKTIGPIEERPGHQCPWGYRSTDGLGLLEFLTWCEDMGAEPVLAVFAGYTLNGQHVDPGTSLAPYVQDALDEIEYVSGSADSPWGSRRAKDGHPAPFKLRYVEIGNEDWFDRSGSYDARFAQFYDAIKARHPKLKIISTVGNEQPDAKRVHSRRPDVLDEHYYRLAADFLRDSPAHFSRYDRNGPEIFVGEWASYEDIVPWDRRSRDLPPTPSMKAALGDAAFMTAMERAADLIPMQCYAPMLVNVNPGGRQWRPNLIGYDALRSFGSPSYHTIRMFSRNVGNTILRTTASGTPLLASATRDTITGAIIVKYVNPTASPQTVNVELKGVRAVKPDGAAIVLSAEPTATNAIDDPARVTPRTERISGVARTFTHTFPPYSITVLRLDGR